MHGKKRTDYKLKLRDPKITAALSQKAEGWHQLCQALAVRRSEPKQITEATTTLTLISKALLVNPDPLYLWNHRREWLLLLWKGQPTINEELLGPEFELTRAALERNPKAYGAWMHRKWTVGQVRPCAAVLEQERALTTLFLKADERNFHCWNYRRFIVGCLLGVNGGGENDNWTGEWTGVAATGMGKQVVYGGTELLAEDPVATVSSSPSSSSSSSSLTILQSELDFTTQKIQENFSNFSAFFYRSQLLVPLSLLTATTTNDEASASSAVINWEEELQLIENAVCTEPDDQTAWWYQALLFSMDQFPVVDLKARLLQQADLLRELLQDSPNSKWIWMGLHRILEAVGENVDEQCLCLVKLQDIDPDRQQRYQELLEATTNGGTAADPTSTS